MRLQRFFAPLLVGALVACSDSDPVTSADEPGTVRGTVQADWWGGSLPVSGADVWVRGDVTFSTVTTDDQGRFQIVGLRPGTHALVVFANGVTFTDDAQVDVVPGTSATVAIVGERDDATLSGSVVLLPRMGDASHVALELRPEGRPGRRTVEVAGDGSFDTSLPWGSYVLEIVSEPEMVLTSSSELTVPPAGLRGVAVESWPVLSQDALVDFETPRLLDARAELDPFIDPASEVRFDAVDTSPGADGVVGLVVNVQTSACVPPERDGQRLGTGVRGSSSVGFAGFPIRASLPALAPRGSTVAVDVQSGATASARMVLYNAMGQATDSATVTIPDHGVCRSNVGSPRGRAQVSVSASEPVASAIIRVEPSNLVFVIDDFRLSRPQVRSPVGG